MTAVSVIICTHNPERGTLDRVIRALAAQTLAKSEWECVVVDNASSPAVESWFPRDWHPSVRVVQEPGQGLTRARLKGIAESRGDILVFVDDDNVLEPGYLQTTIDLFSRYPFVSVLGGRGKGEFSVPVPAWMNPFLHVMAVCDETEDSSHEIQYALTRTIGPWLPTGAGMVVRRGLAESYRRATLADPGRLGLDRTSARSLAGGGDTDMTLTCIDEGMACGVSSRLKFTHVIPPWRVEVGYVKRLLYSSSYGLARLLVAHGWKKAQPREPVSAWLRFRWFLGRLMNRSPADQCWMARHRGYLDGLAGAAYDRKYK